MSFFVKCKSTHIFPVSGFDYMPYMLMDVGENVVVSKEFIARHKK